MSGQKRGKCPIAAAFNLDGDIVLLYCKRWQCPNCAKILSKKWAKRARAGFQPDSDGVISAKHFLTLTLSSYYSTPEQAFKALPKLWNTTRMSFQRRYPSWQYLAFVEGQPMRDDMPHFHILCAEQPPARLGKRGVLTLRTLHDWAVALGWGFEVDLDEVDGPGAAFYVAKYASKVSPHTPKGFRRVRVSRKWPVPEPDPPLPVIVQKPKEPTENYIHRVALATKKKDHDLLAPWLAVQQYLANQ